MEETLDMEKLWGTVVEDYFAQLDAAEEADREAASRCAGPE